VANGIRINTRSVNTRSDAVRNTSPLRKTAGESLRWRTQGQEAAAARAGLRMESAYHQSFSTRGTMRAHRPQAAAASENLLHVTNRLYKEAIFVRTPWARCNKTNNFQCCQYRTLIRVIPEEPNKSIAYRSYRQLKAFTLADYLAAPNEF
jgi:hypothetical protein